MPKSKPRPVPLITPKMRKYVRDFMKKYWDAASADLDKELEAKLLNGWETRYVPAEEAVSARWSRTHHFQEVTDGIKPDCVTGWSRQNWKFEIVRCPNCKLGKYAIVGRRVEPFKSIISGFCDSLVEAEDTLSALAKAEKNGMQIFGRNFSEEELRRTLEGKVRASKKK